MNRRLLAAVALVPAILLPAAASKGAGREEAIIRRMATRFAETWNQHDTTAMAALFAEDADFVNVAGMHWKSRKQIREEHARSHSMQFKESVLTIQGVTVRLLKPDVALAHVEWRLQGDRDPDGTSRAPREGVMSWVVQKRGKEWLVASSHNTNLRPDP